MEEGIKFTCQWKQTPLTPSNRIDELIRCRNDLYQKGLIGEYPDGIGYGNVSVRAPQQGQFFVTAAGTGGTKSLNLSQICLVTEFHIDQNSLRALGQHKPSSESLTHAACYACNSKVEAVAHIHNKELWEDTGLNLPRTDQKIPYGTPEMAHAIGGILTKPGATLPTAIIMAGHEDGILIAGANLQQVCNKIDQIS